MKGREIDRSSKNGKEKGKRDRIDERMKKLERLIKKEEREKREEET